MFRWLSLLLVISFASACSSRPTSTCNPSFCPTGCCQGDACLEGTAATACGTGGVKCVACENNQVCLESQCKAPVVGGGAGSMGGGAGGGSGGGGGSGSALECAPGFAACRGVCVDIRSDALNCGGCGAACTTGFFCQNSQCVPLSTNCSPGSCPTGYTCNSSRKCVAGCSIDGDCPQPGRCDTKSGTCSCITGFHRCGTACFSSTSTQGCGNQCAYCDGVENSQGTCAAAKCDFTCNAGFHRCGDLCLANNSINSCGSSCDPCVPPANARSVCSNSGVCDFACNSGFHRCGDECVSNSDVAHCGSSCSACATPANGQASCNGTSCGVSCDQGFHACGAQCVSNIDVASCGNRCTACTVPTNGSSTCDGTDCGVSCDTGYHACSSACRVNTDPQACGNSCSPCPSVVNGFATCDGTACGKQCNATFHMCGGLCSSNFSAQTCGQSCVACPNGPANSSPSCDGTSCGWTCNNGYNKCGNQCLANSPTSCGSTCQTCTPPANGTATCSAAGVCDFTCQTGFHKCGSQCLANTSVDGCGTSCTPCPNGPPNSTRTCNGTTCGSTCSNGFNSCGGQCVAADFNQACGASCSACTVSTTLERPVCLSSTCATACINTCNNSCVDVLTDENHCGICGRACGSGEVCSNGTCRSACVTAGTFIGSAPAIGSSGLALIASADLNGDGKIDVVRASSTTIEVYLAAGDGTISTATSSLSISSTPTSLQLLDVDGDGKPEIVGVRASTTGTFVAANNGSGAFAFLSSYSTSAVTGATPTSVTVADVNGDGRNDLIVGFTQSTAIAVFFNSPSGLATSATSFSLGISGITSLRAAELSGDSRVDLLALALDRFVPVFVSGSTPTFTAQAAVLFQAGDTVKSMALADVNADGHRDVLLGVTTSSTTGVRVYLADTNGAYPTAPSFVALPQNGSLTAAELNNDANVDLIAGGSTTIAIALGTGPAAWATATQRSLPSYSASSTPQVVFSVNDMNGDSKADLIGGLTGGPPVIIFNNGSGSFPEATVNAVSGSPVTVTAGDVDGDGDADLFVAPAISTNGSGTGTVYVSNGSGQYSAGQSIAVKSEVFVFGQLNADGFADLVTAVESLTTPSVEVRFANDAGVLEAPISLATSGLPTRVLLFDVDGDALSDVVVGSSTTVDAFRNLGNNTFSAPYSTSLGLYSQTALVPADLNLDGKLDLVVTTSYPRVFTLLNLGGGFSSTQTSVSTLVSTPQWVDTGDLNGDGRPDVVVGQSSSAYIYLGAGTGVLTYQSSFSASAISAKGLLIDIDNDGRLDLVGSAADGLRVARGTGSGTFNAFTLFPAAATALSTTGFAVAKVNTDTFPDLVVLTGSPAIGVVSLLGACR